MPFWGAGMFQTLLSEVSSLLESLHDLVMVWLFMITLVVIFISSAMIYAPFGYLSSSSELLEKTMTIFPILILVTVAYPSIHLLCLQDSFSFLPSMTIKILGNQWSWQSTSMMEVDHLLDMDSVENIASMESPVLLKQGEIVRFIVTSTDVLHSLGMPGLGIKLDASPGRLNSIILETNILGLLTGSCFELCGSGHSAMPISMSIF